MLGIALLECDGCGKLHPVTNTERSVLYRLIGLENVIVCSCGMNIAVTDIKPTQDGQLRLVVDSARLDDDNKKRLVAYRIN